MWPTAALAEKIGLYGGIAGIAMLFNAMLACVLIRNRRALSPEQMHKNFRLLIICNFVLGALGIIAWAGLNLVITRKFGGSNTVITNKTSGDQSHIFHDNHGSINIEQQKDDRKESKK